MGLRLADFDDDGLPDMLVVNGEVDDNLAQFGQNSPFQEPSFVWRNQGGGRFRVVTGAGTFFDRPHVARGAAVGDLDNDGRLDVAVNIFGGRAVVLFNDSPPQSWIRLDLKGTASNRSAIGAAVEVHAGEQRDPPPGQRRRELPLDQRFQTADWSGFGVARRSHRRPLAPRRNRCLKPPRWAKLMWCTSRTSRPAKDRTP